MSDKTYNVSFFTPKSDAAKANMKMVVVMLVIWAVAVFGFQFLLIAINKPTPEPVLATFTKAWTALETGTATDQDNKDLSKVILQVLGKNVAVKAPHKEVLKSTLSALVFGMNPQAINDPALAATAIGLTTEGYEPLFASILKSSLVPVTSSDITDANKVELPKLMNLYLIHNRSKLTDTRFLGFPFHYWYTAQFLLILFVGLCWVFCYMTDISNRKFKLEMVEDEEETVVTTPEVESTTEAPKEEK
jgi:putative solute:sodium symporter small subunit